MECCPCAAVKIGHPWEPGARASHAGTRRGGGGEDSQVLFQEGGVGAGPTEAGLLAAVDGMDVPSRSP